MDQKDQMEQPNIYNNRAEPSLYSDFRVSLTPSFLGHGWEYSLSPVNEYRNPYLDTIGSVRIRFDTIRQMLLKVFGRTKGMEVMQSFTMAVTKVFL